jgi:hypothetical protein
MTIEKIQELIQQGAKRKCKKCGNIKFVGEFYIRKCKDNKHNRFNSPCKKCSDINRVEGYMKSYLMKRSYGILPHQFESMMKNQDYKCAICGIHKDNYKKEFAIDHCHNTNKIRGLLCTNCNTGIGMLQDNIEILNSAIKYLLKT